MVSGQGGSGFEPALAEHRLATDAFIAFAGAISQEDWNRPVGPGKWTPGQITEHLCLAFDAVRRELEGGSPTRLLLPAWKRFLLRRTLLPGLLRTGRFPPGARAPREIRPVLSTALRKDALDRLGRAAEELEAFCALDPRAGSRRLAHPYFGALEAPKFFRLLAWHTRHHRLQLPGAAGGLQRTGPPSTSVSRRG